MLRSLRGIAVGVLVLAAVGCHRRSVTTVATPSTPAATKLPTAVPTATETESPTATGTGLPTSVPTATVTNLPTSVPTATVTELPTSVPTATATKLPTWMPTIPPPTPTETAGDSPTTAGR